MFIYTIWKEGAWTYRKDDYMQSMMADGLDLYGAKDGILYKLDKSRNVQYARFDTKEFLTEFPEIEKRFRRLIIQARIPMGMCLDVSVKIDGEFMPEISYSHRACEHKPSSVLYWQEDSSGCRGLF